MEAADPEDRLYIQRVLRRIDKLAEAGIKIQVKYPDKYANPRYDIRTNKQHHEDLTPYEAFLFVAGLLEGARYGFEAARKAMGKGITELNRRTE